MFCSSCTSKYNPDFIKWWSVYFFLFCLPCCLTCLLLDVSCRPNIYFARISPLCNLSKHFENNRVSYDWYIGMSVVSESFVSMWLSSQSLLWCPCSSLAMIGETIGALSCLTSGTADTIHYFSFFVCVCVCLCNSLLYVLIFSKRQLSLTSIKDNTV